MKIVNSSSARRGQMLVACSPVELMHGIDGVAMWNWAFGNVVLKFYAALKLFFCNLVSENGVF